MAVEKDNETPEQVGDELERSNRKRNIIIGVTAACVLALVIGIPTLLLRNQDQTHWAEMSDITELQGQIDSMKLTLAEHTEDIINLSDIPGFEGEFNALKADVENLQDTVDGLSGAYDWTANITALETSFAELQALVNSFSFDIPRYAVVGDFGETYLNISTYGEGDYPVIVTFYGLNLLPGEIRAVDLAPYAIMGEVSNNTTLTMFIEPDVAWLTSDDIILVVNDITGSVDYVTALTGG